MKLIVTTSQSSEIISTQLNLFLQETELEFIPRRRKSLEYLAEDNNAQGVIVWHEEGPILHMEGEKFFFHPSMAKNRLAAYRKRHIEDTLVKACDLHRSDSFLDCTLGMGADSIVASYFTDGRVSGLESSYPVAIIVKWGMKTYQTKISWLMEPIKKVDVCCVNHYEFLKSQPDNSYDIVYFDPMFRHPMLKSQSLAPLRLIADHNPLTRETIEEACRVARKRVVMKEQFMSNEMQKLGFAKFAGSINNKISYGYITL